MARNEEKQFSRLNRLLMQRDKEEGRKRNPKRPKLDSLNSVEDIKEWLPSIKRDLDFSLKQSEVTCYSEQKIAEIQSNILQLEREFKSFVRKSKQLKPGMEHVPWTNRPYISNKTKTEEKEIVYNKGTFVPINTPILEENSLENKECQMNFTNVNMDQLDMPLQFKTTVPGRAEKRSPKNQRREEPKVVEESKMMGETTAQTACQPDSMDNSHPSKNKCNLLGLDYSSSDSDS